MLLHRGDGPGRRGTRVLRRIRARSQIGFARADRLTTVLAVGAVGVAGSVLAAEYVRRFQRRLSERRAAGGPVEESAAGTLIVAAEATQDTVRVAIEGYESMPRREVVLFNLLSGFAGAFAVARISTGGMRAGWWPLDNVRVGGRHIHHFVPGIVIAFASGTAALVTEDLDREAVLAFPFGIGLGLTFDEAALLLDLRDVYWTREGVLSVQLSSALVIFIAGTILALRLLRRGERRGEQRGLIPDAEGAILARFPATDASAPADERRVDQPRVA